MPPQLGFDLLISSRYLRARAKKPWVRVITLIFVLLTAAVFSAHAGLDAYMKRHYDPRLYAALPVLYYAKYVAVFVTFQAAVFVELIRRLTVFTTISTFGLFLGSEALVLVLSIMGGFEQDLKQKILGAHAHMVVTTPDRPFTDYREAIARVEKIAGVVAATPYLSSELMLASPSNLSAVAIKGIDPQTIGRVTDLVKNTGVGSLDNLLHPDRIRAPGANDAPGPAGPPGPADPEGKDRDREVPRAKKRRVLPGVVVGCELAKNLRIYLGDDVNVVSPMGDIGPTGPIPKAKPFRVAAVFCSGMYEYDSKYIYMDLPAAQKFLGVDDEVTGLELKLKEPDRTAGVAAALRAALDAQGTGAFLVQDWKELNSSLFSALKLEKIAMFIVLCFIILVAAFSIISNGIMLVMEKGKEVAILKSMGASDRTILRVFVWLGLAMGTLGTGVGILLGIGFCALLRTNLFGLRLSTDVYYITKLPVNLNPLEVLAVLGASLLLSLCATLYPAWLAARLRPVEGLR
jgi:lipoprotein-releasing system permease protein